MSVDFVSPISRIAKTVGSSWGILFFPYMVFVLSLILHNPGYIAGFLDLEGAGSDRVVIEHFVLDLVVFLGLPGAGLTWAVIAKKNRELRSRKERFCAYYEGQDLRIIEPSIQTVYRVIGSQASSGKLIVKTVWEDGHPVLDSPEQTASPAALQPFDVARFMEFAE